MKMSLIVSVHAWAVPPSPKAAGSTHFSVQFDENNWDGQSRNEPPSLKRNSSTNAPLVNPDELTDVDLQSQKKSVEESVEALSVIQQGVTGSLTASSECDVMREQLQSNHRKALSLDEKLSQRPEALDLHSQAAASQKGWIVTHDGLIPDVVVASSTGSTIKQTACRRWTGRCLDALQRALAKAAKCLGERCSVGGP